MPFLLIILGLILTVTAAQDTYVDFGNQVKSDFSNKQGSFLWYGVAIIMCGVFGYIDQLRKLSIAFMALILLVLFLRDKNFFQQLTQQLNATPIAPKASGAATPSVQTAPTVGQSSAKSSAATLGYLGDLGLKLGETFGIGP